VQNNANTEKIPKTEYMISKKRELCRKISFSGNQLLGALDKQLARTLDRAG
jgi:hypothetical protein